ncbi:hypothetical protein BJP36_37840 [Moorena producens JHB]|uniref:Uncharacterized protein n=1 Tax=Moorena producens (strain JHB) TaxID=1454205 RepID=A0A9Q9UWG8_MOOP1|nr:hypothetical protein [Moorena producens]WAN69859.1 hypothetical protein BJP36_37840 [Moorena producens JHB]
MANGHRRSLYPQLIRFHHPHHPGAISPCDLDQPSTHPKNTIATLIIAIAFYQVRSQFNTSAPTDARNNLFKLLDIVA